MSQLIVTPRVYEAVLTILNNVAQAQCPLDKAYAQHFFNFDYASQDHAVITQITGDMVRKLNLYSFITGNTITHITSNPAVLFYAWSKIEQQTIPSFIDLTQQEIDNVEQLIDTAKHNQSLMDGCPAWLNTLGENELADSWPQERSALALAAKRFIRANLLKTNTVELQKTLEKEHITTRLISDCVTALEITSNSSLFKSLAFKNGLFEQQDVGSQLIIEALDVKPGMRVIDACSGAGGKTLGLAAYMKGKGRLLAMDIEEHKLAALKQRAKRAGADNIETRLITSSKTIKRLKESADRLLLDVPCSGLGVLKRNPDAKWHSDMSESLPTLRHLQQDILTRYSKMLKVDGIIVYATCSILPSENELQVSAFLKANPNYKLINETTISPAQSGFDGFYFASLQRISA